MAPDRPVFGEPTVTAAPDSPASTPDAAPDPVPVSIPAPLQARYEPPETADRCIDLDAAIATRERRRTRYPLLFGVAGLVALLLIVTATHVGQGLLIARLLADVLGGASPGELSGPVAGILALQLVRIAVIVVRDGWAAYISGRVKEAVRERLTAKLIEIGPGQAQQLRTGELQSVVVDSVELLDPLIGRFVPSVYGSVLGAGAASACIMVIDPLVGVVVLVCAVSAPLSELGGARWIKGRGDRWTRAYRGLYAENLDAVQGMAIER